MYSEIRLIREMKQGSEEAFDAFVRQYYPQIQSYCYFHCPDREYADDLTQETFIRFFAKLSAYHYRGKTLNYLYTIARNLCMDYARKNREMPEEESALAQETGREGAETEKLLDRLLIEQALERLPEELREVIILRFFQELKLKEISQVLEIGLPLVKYRLAQGKKQLEELLGEEENHGSGK